MKMNNLFQVMIGLWLESLRLLTQGDLTKKVSLWPSWLTNGSNWQNLEKNKSAFILIAEGKKPLERTTCPCKPNFGWKLTIHATMFRLSDKRVIYLSSN